MTDASKKGRSSRLKGQRGERELANELSDLLGITLKRRVRNHANESDVEGLPGFSIEVKNCAELNLKDWWKQTVRQAGPWGVTPVLFYKIPRKGFRAVLPLHIFDPYPSCDLLEYTLETSLQGFAMIYREYIKDV